MFLLFAVFIQFKEVNDPKKETESKQLSLSIMILHISSQLNSFTYLI